MPLLLVNLVIRLHIQHIYELSNVLKLHLKFKLNACEHGFTKLKSTEIMHNKYSVYREVMRVVRIPMY
jgi:hypothetical protein